MKIALNLSTSTKPRERFGLAWAAPVTLLGSVVLVYCLFSAMSSVREYRKVHRSLLALEDLQARLQQNEMTLRRELDRPQLDQVFHQAQLVNGLIDKKQFSFTELTATVTQLLPPTVRLTGLTLSAPGGEPVVRFTVMATSEEALEAFLGNLEESPNFNDVAIVNQGMEEAGSAGGSVVIACTAHYLGGARR